MVLETSDKSVMGGEKNECTSARKHKPERRLKSRVIRTASRGMENDVILGGRVEEKGEEGREQDR